MTEQIEKPHTIKDFDEIAHEAMIRRMAAQVIRSNKSSIETVQKYVSQFKEDMQALKAKQNQKQIKKQRANNLSVLASMIRHCG
jgi:hypothetical protein